MMDNLIGFSDLCIFPLFLVMRHHYGVISCLIVFKFAYVVEHSRSYQPVKFQCCRLSGSSFTEGLQKHNVMTLFHIVRI